MGKKWLYSILIGTLLVISLTGCNGDNNDNIAPEDVNFNPVRYDPNNDVNDNNLNRGPDLDLDPRDDREPNERDNPLNMDEEEPDLLKNYRY